MHANVSRLRSSMTKHNKEKFIERSYIKQFVRSFSFKIVLIKRTYEKRNNPISFFLNTSRFRCYWESKSSEKYCRKRGLGYLLKEVI